MEKELTIFDVWTLPFKSDMEDLFIYVWDSDHHMCFDFLTDDEKECKRILALLNGKEDALPYKNVTKHKDFIVASDDKEPKTLLMVRGWGYLTGSGALKLDTYTAIRLQNELVDYAVKQLKGLNYDTRR